jgi:hypothetical protein
LFINKLANDTPQKHPGFIATIVFIVSWASKYVATSIYIHIFAWNDNSKDVVSQRERVKKLVIPTSHTAIIAIGKRINIKRVRVEKGLG